MGNGEARQQSAGLELPEEALLLAAVAELGQVAREWLARWGYPLPWGTGLGALPALVARLGGGLGPVGTGEGRVAAQRAAGHRASPLLPREGAGPGVGWAELAGMLEAYWQGQPEVATLSRYGEDVDVGTAQGRWELLALAVLLGGPVARERVEEAFVRLRRLGLLRWEEVLEASEEWARRVDEVLRGEYRGPVNPTRVRERLVHAARCLAERFGGDLQEVWRQAGEEPSRCRQLLRESFPGVDRMAAWVLREMGRKGAWPGAHRHAAAVYVDSAAREVLENLGLLQAGSTVQQAEMLVRRHLPQAAAYLFCHGRELCGRYSPAVCLRECPLRPYCARWRRLQGNGGGGPGAEPNRETPAKRPAGARQVHSEPAGGAAIHRWRGGPAGLDSEASRDRPCIDRCLSFHSVTRRGKLTRADGRIGG